MVKYLGSGLWVATPWNTRMPFCFTVRDDVVVISTDDVEKEKSLCLSFQCPALVSRWWNGHPHPDYLNHLLDSGEVLAPDGPDMPKGLLPRQGTCLVMLGTTSIHKPYIKNKDTPKPQKYSGLQKNFLFTAKEVFLMLEPPAELLACFIMYFLWLSHKVFRIL